MAQHDTSTSTAQTTTSIPTYDPLDLIHNFSSDEHTTSIIVEKPKMEKQDEKPTFEQEHDVKLVATIQLDSHTKLLSLKINEKEENQLSSDQENYLIRNVVYPCNSLMEKHVSKLDKYYSVGVVVGVVILCVISLCLVIPLIVDMDNSLVYFLIAIPFVLGIGIVVGVLFYFLRRKIVNNHSICEAEIERVLRVEEERIRESNAEYESFFKDSERVNVKLQLDYPNIRRISLKNTWKFLTDSPSILIYFGE
ncbi:predicted protein [Naegleria gruberi]|uniref:Predicted protein n=1 Tax=Naegleria gruberi TaxID=5762 RepID=D2VWY0_NAEGR|nr:uncharacterized protein NAEGRDRAFT_73543 [Naegleria gruberi]EFC38768.1 predicted protein [Naegleria gruberi]|eukprot:XP_002671512.1 predicted protein [Naegleria gruberi strain NEG-M]